MARPRYIGNWLNAYVRGVHVNFRFWHSPAVHAAILTAGKRIVALCDQANYSDHLDADNGDTLHPTPNIVGRIHEKLTS